MHNQYNSHTIPIGTYTNKVRPVEVGSHNLQNHAPKLKIIVTNPRTNLNRWLCTSQLSRVPRLPIMLYKIVKHREDCNKDCNLARTAVIGYT